MPSGHGMGPHANEARAWLAGLSRDTLAAVRFTCEPSAEVASLTGDEVLLWDARPRPSEERTVVTGEGIASRVDASGAERFDDVAARGSAVLDGIATFGGAHPRLFGGFAFEHGERETEWAAFGDASFVLPERIVERTASSTAVTIVGRAGRLREPGVLERLRHPRSESVERVAPTNGTVEMDPDTVFTSMVVRAVETIGTAAFEKVVLARRTRVTSGGRLPWDRVIASLKAGAHATRFAFVREPRAFIGATPETLVSLANGELTTEAVAGTAAREGDDASEVRALLESEKDRREHDVVRDTIVRALEPHATSIIADATQVTSLPNVHHLVSSIAATPRHGTHIVRVVGSLHPTPAVAGWPTDLARRFIRSSEGWSRGWYAAPIGWFDKRGEGVFCVGIRSALVDERGAWVYAGAGIVRGSRPEVESKETRAKQAPMIAALTGGR